MERRDPTASLVAIEQTKSVLLPISSASFQAPRVSAGCREGDGVSASTLPQEETQHREASREQQEKK